MKHKPKASKAPKSIFRLGSRDYDLLLGCIRELHSFQELAALRLWLIEDAFPRLIPSDWYSYNEVDLKSPQKTRALLRPELKSFSVLLPKFAVLVHQHPLVRRQMNRQDLSARKISDFLSRESYHQLDLYTEVYGPMGVEYQIAAALETHRNHITAFALSRRSHDYTERDRAVLEHVRGQLLVALQNLRLASRDRQAIADTTLAMDQHLLATLSVSREGRILAHSGDALKWIGPCPKGRLPSRILNWSRLRLAPSGMGKIKDPPLLLNRDHGEITIRVLPATGHSGRMVLSLRLDPSGVWLKNSGAHKLSPREFEVAWWVSEGKSNAAIAAILGISPRTVQKHVENIFERLGVESRVAVTVRMLEKSPDRTLN
jgi:DNA-binding CsgD family transcriptional regulator